MGETSSLSCHGNSKLILKLSDPDPQDRKSGWSAILKGIAFLPRGDWGRDKDAFHSDIELNASIFFFTKTKIDLNLK